MGTDTIRKAAGRKQKKSMQVDLGAILSIDHTCNGCAKGEPCCCATYEVCITAAELDRIIRVLPEAAKYCPHLKIDKGYDNVFEKVEPGLFAIETTEDGLCLLAYQSRGKVHCSLHSVAINRGLPLSEVKPKPCLLWPMNFSDGEEVLSLTLDALLFSCNSRKDHKRSDLSPALAKAIEIVYGKGCRDDVMKAAAKGLRRTKISLYKYPSQR